MLNTNELFELEDSLKEVFDSDLTAILTKLNRTNRLHELLELLGLESLYPGYSCRFSNYGTGKIVVVGASHVKELHLFKEAEALGISRERFEFHLDYNEASRFDYKKMQYRPEYTLVMFGPVHHSGHEKGDYSSVITAIENTDGYPPVVRLGENELKITKTGFRNALSKCIEEGIVIAM